MEDAIMAYRIVRSPERRVFYIDVGNINPADIEQYMQKVMTQMKRNQIMNDDTGRVDLRYNPMSVEEDYYIPVRGDNHSKIETLSGGSYTGDIDDVKYLRDKLFSALKIPASYLSSGEGMDEDKTTLAQKDIRFARTIQRLQRSVVAELEKVGVIHLFTLGYRGNDLVSFKLFLNNPSKLAEMQELEHWRVKFDVASAATEGFFSKRWVSEHLFNLTEEEFLRSQRELFYDRKFEANLEKAVEEITADPDEGLDAGGVGGGLGELGALGGPGEDLGGEDLGGEDLGDEGGLEDVTEPPSDDVLLAAPAKRDDVKSPIKVKRKTGETTTSKSKGHWYMPKKDDTRDMGARQRSYMGHTSRELASSTSRNLWKGASEMRSLSKGIYENKKEEYHEKEEQAVLKLNFEVKKLIKDMESKKK